VTGEAPLLVRADASARMGTGHAMRCLALAQSWQEAGGSCLFAMGELTPAVRLKIEAAGFEVVTLHGQPGAATDSNQVVELARQRRCNHIVVDGYQFEADYQQALKSAGLKTLMIDDYGHARHYYCDLVLNQNVSADQKLYANREACTRLLLGPRYALLRNEFDAWRNFMREIPAIAHRVLITLGGSDPENVTHRAMEAVAMADLADLEAVVVVGGSNPDFESLQHSGLEFARRHNMKISVQRDVANMAELMAWADIAISAAGTTCWELCLLALPSLLIDVAENQTGVARELHRLKCAVHLGSAQEVSVELLRHEVETMLKSQEVRQTLSRRSRELVDGKGAQRVVSVLRGSDVVHLRRAREDDSRLLFEWANDSEVRAAALSSNEILWAEHVLWFANKMKNPDCTILIAEDERGDAIGQFRIDWRSAQDGEIDVSVSRDWRERKYGGKVIRLGVEAAFAGKPALGARLHAFVKLQNQASRRAFESAGFRSLGEEDRSGFRMIHYVIGGPTLE
jgi:UDP-2,4-diacetamido-2,4,6-trideoxy-beta-L-altropyranose hydrolase